MIAGIEAMNRISKGSFTNYMKNRLSGFDAAETDPWPGPPDDFPEFAEMSRRYGGIHFYSGDMHGRALGNLLGRGAYAKAQSYIQGRIGS